MSHCAAEAGLRHLILLVPGRDSQNTQGNNDLREEIFTIF